MQPVDLLLMVNSIRGRPYITICINSFFSFGELEETTKTPRPRTTCMVEDLKSKISLNEAIAVA